MIRLLTAAASPAIVVSVIIVACSSEAPEDFTQPAPTVEEQADAQDDIASHPGATAHGWSGDTPVHPLEYLSGFNFVVTGTVESLVDKVYSQAAEEDSGECPPVGHPKYGSCPVVKAPPNLFRYSFRVDRVIRTTAVPLPETILAIESGFAEEISYEDGSVGWSETGVEAMRVGGRYMLFLNEGLGRGYEGWQGFGRFEVDSFGRLRPVDKVWLILPGVTALTGLTVDEAIVRMDEADREFERALEVYRARTPPPLVPESPAATPVPLPSPLTP